MEDLNRALFAWMAAGYTPQPLLLITAQMIAEYTVAIVPLVLLAIWFRRPACRDIAVAAVLCGGAALAASELIAAITAHPRPFMLGLSPMYVTHSPEGSFPSAHLSLMLGVAAALLVASGTRAWGALLAGSALLMGWARVYIGLHFPMDIAGSLVVAAFVAALLRGNYRWIVFLRRKLERVTGRFAILAAGAVRAVSTRRQSAGK